MAGCQSKLLGGYWFDRHAELQHQRWGHLAAHQSLYAQVSPILKHDADCNTVFARFCTTLRKLQGSTQTSHLSGSPGQSVRQRLLQGPKGSCPLSPLHATYRKLCVHLCSSFRPADGHIAGWACWRPRPWAYLVLPPILTGVVHERIVYSMVLCSIL